jgi:DNA-3-methyladenine glycosylase I
VRCTWAQTDNEMYRDYHDQEWGRPLHGRIALFERMSLEAFQSGLSWLIILRKRDNFRLAFDGFDIEKVARYDDGDVQRLMADTGIVRNSAKIAATACGHRARHRPVRAAVVVRPAAATPSETDVGRSGGHPGVDRNGA